MEIESPLRLYFRSRPIDPRSPRRSQIALQLAFQTVLLSAVLLSIKCIPRFPHWGPMLIGAFYAQAKFFLLTTMDFWDRYNYKPKASQFGHHTIQHVEDHIHSDQSWGRTHEQKIADFVMYLADPGQGAGYYYTWAETATFRGCFIALYSVSMIPLCLTVYILPVAKVESFLEGLWEFVRVIVIVTFVGPVWRFGRPFVESVADGCRVGNLARKLRKDYVGVKGERGEKGVEQLVEFIERLLEPYTYEGDNLVERRRIIRESIKV